MRVLSWTFEDALLTASKTNANAELDKMNGTFDDFDWE